MFIYMGVRLPLYAVACSYERKGQMDKRDEMIRKHVHLWASRLLKHIRMNVVIEGEENLPSPDEAVMFAANHQSYLDIPVLLACINPPFPLLARDGIGRVPILGLWMKKLDCVLINRDDTRAAMQGLRDAERLLKSGKSLHVFPEGTRSKSGNVREFKSGALRVAVKAGVRIVPIAIQGTYHGLEGDGMKLKPANVRLTILPAHETSGLNRDEQKELGEKLRQAICAEMEKTPEPQQPQK